MATLELYDRGITYITGICEVMRNIFRIRKDERWVVLVALFVIGVFQYLIISKFFPLFANYSEAHWTVFMNNFHMSGYDPITYRVVSDWTIGYNLLRHPLLPYMMAPLYLVNQLLWWTTSVNCVQLVVGCLLLFCSTYSFLFLYRIVHDFIGVGRGDALLLTLMFFGFAHVLVAVIVPDHFCLSLFLILMTLCMAGERLKEGRPFSYKEIVVLFTLTAGVTLSNGVITGIILLWVNGRRCLELRTMLSLGAISLLLMGSALIVNSVVEEPSDQQVDEWVDAHLSRRETLVENFFGESIQLHRKHVLGDVLTRRPVFVHYTWQVQYWVEGLIVLLMALGIWAGRRSHLLQIACACFLYTVLLHLVLGFAINEVYIMTAHWAWVIPMSVACLMLAVGRKTNILLRIMVATIVAYLWIYHGVLLYNYLTWPIKYACLFPSIC